MDGYIDIVTIALSHLQTHFDPSESLQQTTFENIVTKGEIAQNEQFLLLPQCFQPFLVIIPTIMEIFPYSLVDIFEIVCCIFVVCGKGL